MSSNYFSKVLPDYDKECLALSVSLALTFGFWMVVFPFVSHKLRSGSPTEKSRSEPQESNGPKESPLNKINSKEVASSKGARQRRGKGKKQLNGTAAHDSGTPSSTKKSASPEALSSKTEASQEASLAVSSVAALGFMVSAFYILVTMSPYNYFAGRGVFQVPMFTAEECDRLLDISHRAAQHNYESALQYQKQSGGESLNRTIKGWLEEPVGWHKLRHEAYPTTDLNIVTDPFEKEDLDWLKEKLDARMAPTLARIYGIPAKAIRANDMFVVRYDSGFRTRLSNHTDNADISFNILLTDTFEGGGTRFWSRDEEKPFALVQPKKVGQMLTHSAMINHEGMPTTKGTRIIFVGFLSVDRIDPFSTETNPKSRLNIFSSWLSLPWVSVKFAEGYDAANTRARFAEEKWSNNKYVKSFFLDMASVLTAVGDYVFPHHVETLVKEEDTEKHLQALDEAYNAKQQSAPDEPDKANWFAGQQIDLDIDGTMSSEWYTRANSRNRFMEL